MTIMVECFQPLVLAWPSYVIESNLGTKPVDGEISDFLCLSAFKNMYVQVSSYTQIKMMGLAL